MTTTIPTQNFTAPTQHYQSGGVGEIGSLTPATVIDDSRLPRMSMDSVISMIMELLTELAKCLKKLREQQFQQGQTSSLAAAKEKLESATEQAESNKEKAWFSIGQGIANISAGLASLAAAKCAVKNTNARQQTKSYHTFTGFSQILQGSGQLVIGIGEKKSADNELLVAAKEFQEKLMQMMKEAKDHEGELTEKTVSELMEAARNLLETLKAILQAQADTQKTINI